jgi:hypothetical protein
MKHRDSPPPSADRSTREQRLAEALRANLRRRKAAGKTSAEPEQRVADTKQSDRATDEKAGRGQS